MRAVHKALHAVISGNVISAYRPNAAHTAPCANLRSAAFSLAHRSLGRKRKKYATCFLRSSLTVAVTVVRDLNSEPASAV